MRGGFSIGGRFVNWGAFCRKEFTAEHAEHAEGGGALRGLVRAVGRSRDDCASRDADFHERSEAIPGQLGTSVEVAAACLDPHPKVAASSQGFTQRATENTPRATELARIKRGLLRATALEAGLASGTARLEPRPAEARSPRPPRLAHPAVPLPPLPSLVLLPTSAQIAAEIRRRPAGAVLADICRDLGIMANHPLWPEIRELLTRHGGNLATLYIDISRRLSALFIERCAAAAAEATPPPGLLSPGPASTGPP